MCGFDKTLNSFLILVVKRVHGFHSRNDGQSMSDLGFRLQLNAHVNENVGWSENDKMLCFNFYF